eukprot:15470620-Alexandrium_andersonii.AAC.1
MTWMQAARRFCEYSGQASCVRRAMGLINRAAPKVQQLWGVDTIADVCHGPQDGVQRAPNPAK